MARKRVGRPPLPEPKYQESNRPTSAVAIEKVEELPANIFTEPVDITKSKEKELFLKYFKFSNITNLIFNIVVL